MKNWLLFPLVMAFSMLNAKTTFTTIDKETIITEYSQTHIEKETIITEYTESLSIEDNEYEVVFVDKQELTEQQIIIIFIYVSKLESL